MILKQKNISFDNVGFTLIELLVVVAIVGILAGVGMAVFSEYRAKAYDAQALSLHTNVKTFLLSIDPVDACIDRNASCSFQANSYLAEFSDQSETAINFNMLYDIRIVIPISLDKVSGSPLVLAYTVDYNKLEGEETPIMSVRTAHCLHGKTGYSWSSDMDGVESFYQGDPQFESLCSIIIS